MKIPKRREVNPELGRALDRQIELRTEIQALQAEARTIAASSMTDDRASRAAALIGAVS